MLSILLGLLAWGATQFLGLALAAGGHGWGGPFFVSMPLIFLYPLAVVAALGSKARLAAVPAVALVAAAGLDGFLLLGLPAELRYIGAIWNQPGGALFISAWLGLWAAWQILLIVGLLRRRSAAQRPAAGQT